MGLKLKIKKPIAAAQVGGAQAAQVRATPQAPLAEGTSFSQPRADQKLAATISSAKATLAPATDPVKKKPKLKLKRPAASALDRQAPSALSSGPNHQPLNKTQPVNPRIKLVQSKRPLHNAQVADVLPTKGMNGLVAAEPPKKKPKLKIKATKPTLGTPKIEIKPVPVAAPVLAPLAPSLAPAAMIPPLGVPGLGGLPGSAKHTPVKIKLKASSAATSVAPKKLKIKQSIAPTRTPIKSTPVTRKPPSMPGPLEVKVKKKARSELKGPHIQPPAVRSAPPAKPAAPAPAAVQPAPAVPAEPEALKEGTAFYDALTANVAEEELVSEKALLSMVNKLIRKDKDNTFKIEPQKGPLSSRIKSAYKAAIKHPMALTTIKESIKASEGLKMQTWHQMALALDLMVANCVKFNSADSPISKAAAAIRAEFDRIREKDKAAAVVAAAAAAADAAPGTEEAVEMPRLRSAMAPEQQLPPRRAAALASMMREHAAPRRAGRGGGRGPRAPHVNMRMIDHGIKRSVELNARASFYKRTEDTACFGAALGGWNVETGRSWWLNRPKLGHAYPKKYIPFNFCALKTAFHVGRLREKMFAEIRRKAAHTVYCKVIAVAHTAPPASGGQAPIQQAGTMQSRPGPDQYTLQQQHSKMQTSSAAVQRQPVQYQNHGYSAGHQKMMNVHQQQQPNAKGVAVAQQPKATAQKVNASVTPVQYQPIQHPGQVQPARVLHQSQTLQQKQQLIGAQQVQVQTPVQGTSQGARLQQ